MSQCVHTAEALLQDVSEGVVRGRVVRQGAEGPGKVGPCMLHGVQQGRDEGRVPRVRGGQSQLKNTIIMRLLPIVIVSIVYV